MNRRNFLSLASAVWPTGERRGAGLLMLSGKERRRIAEDPWWTAQVAAFATLTGDETAKALAWERYRRHLVPRQVRPDGSCPEEEARTRSLSYSSMNLDGFAVLCRTAGEDGVDLWRYRTDAGTGIGKAFDYLLPYVLRPGAWTKPQISSYEQDRAVFPALAGLGLRRPEMLAAYAKLPRAAAPRVMLVDLLVGSAAAG